MPKWNWERLGAASGIVFVALLIVTIFVPAASPPDTSDSAAKITSFIVDHRTGILIGTYIGGLALVFFLWFLGSLGAALRATGEARLAAVAFGGGVATAAVALGQLAIQTAGAYRVAEESDPGLVKALFDLQALAPFAFPVAVLVGATSIAALRSRLFPEWYSLAGIVVGLWFVVGGAALARNGFFSPQGGYGFIGFIAFLVWMLVTSVLLIQRAGAAEAVQTPAAATM